MCNNPAVMSKAPRKVSNDPGLPVSGKKRRVLVVVIGGALSPGSNGTTEGAGVGVAATETFGVLVGVGVVLPVTGVAVGVGVAVGDGAGVAAAQALLPPNTAHNRFVLPL